MNNLSKRAKVDSRNSLLELFVESPWEKKEIVNLEEWLSSQGIDVNSKNWHYAWKDGREGNASVEPDNNVTDEDAFKERITSKLKNVLPLLLKCNNDVNYTNKNGQTILHVYLSNKESDYRNSQGSSRSQIVDIVLKLIERGASVNAVDNWGKTPLHYASNTRKLEIVQLLLDLFSSVDVCDNIGNTLLHSVVHDNFDESNLCLEVVGTLLSKGAAVNKKNKAGLTPVQLAVQRCSFYLLPILKENGADFSVFTNNNDNLLLLAYKHYYYKIDESTLVKIIDFLVNEGCDVNAKNNDGYSVLYAAIKWNRSIGRLIELGADVNSQTRIECQTPLHFAVISQASGKNIMALLRAGAYCEALDYKGRTPLDIALENRYTKMLIRILEFGGDINNPNTASFWRKCGKELHQILICHADKLYTIGFPVDQAYTDYLYNRDTRLYKRDEYCYQEVRKLKAYIINEQVSIYQFLHMHSKRQLTYVDYLPRDLASRFPIYANFIITARNKAVWRTQLLVPAKMAWYQSTKINLPDICVERILYFLDNWHLKVLINSTERNID